jgi:hypothetical protein
MVQFSREIVMAIAEDVCFHNEGFPRDRFCREPAAVDLGADCFNGDPALCKIT